MIPQETPAVAHHRARDHRNRCVRSGHASTLAHAFNRQRPAVAVGDDGHIVRWQVVADAQAIGPGDDAAPKAVRRVSMVVPVCRIWWSGLFQLT